MARNDKGRREKGEIFGTCTYHYTHIASVLSWLIDLAPC